LPESKRTPEIIAAILKGLEDGKSLRRICAGKGMPSKGAFLNWVDEDAELADQYTRVRARGWDAMAEQAVDEAEEAEDASLARLAFDARRWYLGKMAPKKYGDKVALGQADDLGPLTVIINKPE